MLLVIDVGNTNMVLGIYRGDTLLENWRVETRASRTEDELGILLRQLFGVAGVDIADVKNVIVSCVVPPMLRSIRVMTQRYLNLEPLIVGPGTKTGMPIRYENPREVGADRIVNAVAAYEQVKSELIIVDFGTATTFDAVSRSGEYLGGAICPGLVVSTEALFQRASKLPRVQVAEPKQVIGRTTVDSLTSGIFYGAVGMVDTIVAGMKVELGGEPRVFATGGLATLIASKSESIDVVAPMLTLEGLRIIHRRNE